MILSTLPTTCLRKLQLPNEGKVWMEVLNADLLIIFSLSPSSEKDKITTRTLKARMD